MTKVGCRQLRGIARERSAVGSLGATARLCLVVSVLVMPLALWAICTGAAAAATGALDETFGDAGKTVVATGGRRETYLDDVAVAPNGKIVAVGHTYGRGRATERFFVVRLRANGQRDRRFGNRGIARLSFLRGYDAEAHGVIVQPDGKIVVAGALTDPRIDDPDVDDQKSSAVALARLKTDGRLDRSFGGEGRVVTRISKRGGAANAVALQRDGKIVVAGMAETGNVTRFLAVRYLRGGKLDNSFADRGIKVLKPITPGDADANDVALAPDGRIVLVGASGEGDAAPPGVLPAFALARLDAGGELDPTFGSGGVVTNAVGQADGLRAAIVLADGSIVAVGSTLMAPLGYRFAVQKYLPTGALDTSFGNGGTAVTAVGNRGLSFANDVAVTDRGDVIAIGTAANRATVIGHTPFGQLDPEFGSQGVSRFPSDNRTYASAAVLRQGKLVIVGGMRAKRRVPIALRVDVDGAAVAP